MTWLLDTNIVLRFDNTTDPQHAEVRTALAALDLRGDVLAVAPQVMVEYRAVATRPVSVNGLGLSAAEASAAVARFEQQFALLPDDPAIYAEWKRVVDALGVVGKQVHDARLVAVCRAHAAGGVLTLNAGHFARLAAAAPGLAVATPADVLAGRA